MWPRVVEMALACWLAMSPFVFAHPAQRPGWWWYDLAGAAVVFILAAGSLWWPLRRLHLLQLAVAAWMIGFGYLAAPYPTPPALQNNVVVGLLLLLFGVLPNDVNRPPVSWRRYIGPEAVE